MFAVTHVSSRPTHLIRFFNKISHPIAAHSITGVRSLFSQQPAGNIVSITNTLSGDRLTKTRTIVWKDEAAYNAFVASAGSLLTARETQRNEYNNIVGITHTVTTETI